MLSASLPVAISGIVTYIAWQQFVINRRQHRLALFEKRLVVFSDEDDRIGCTVGQSDAARVLSVHIQDTRDHEFLFGQEVGDFINEVYKKATALHAHIMMGPGGAAQQTQVMTWFIGQMGEARKIFLPYLDFRKP